MASLGKILTIISISFFDKNYNIYKCYIIVMDWCCICKKSVETPDHLLHCEIAGVTEFGFLNIWSRVGYAQMKCGALGMLEMKVLSKRF